MASHPSSRIIHMWHWGHCRARSCCRVASVKASSSDSSVNRAVRIPKYSASFMSSTFTASMFRPRTLRTSLDVTGNRHWGQVGKTRSSLSFVAVVLVLGVDSSSCRGSGGGVNNAWEHRKILFPRSVFSMWRNHSSMHFLQKLWPQRFREKDKMLLLVEMGDEVAEVDGNSISSFSNSCVFVVSAVADFACCWPVSPSSKTS